MLGQAPSAPAKRPPLIAPPPATPEPAPPSVPALPFTAAAPEVHSLSSPELRQRHPALPLLVDVTPLTLCVETVGGFRDVIIARNTPVPCEQSRSFVTSQTAQQTVLVRVGQGEAPHFAENTLLGELELSGLRSALRGEVRVVVTFSLDTDGMLDVRAADEETGQASTARLRLVGLPDAEEVGRMTQRHLMHRS
jgi:molecular chaperone DnaK